MSCAVGQGERCDQHVPVNCESRITGSHIARKTCIIFGNDRYDAVSRMTQCSASTGDVEGSVVSGSAYPRLPAHTSTHQLEQGGQPLVEWLMSKRGWGKDLRGVQDRANGLNRRFRKKNARVHLAKYPTWSHVVLLVKFQVGIHHRLVS